MQISKIIAFYLRKGVGRKWLGVNREFQKSTLIETPEEIADEIKLIEITR